MDNKKVKELLEPYVNVVIGDHVVFRGACYDENDKICGSGGDTGVIIDIIYPEYNVTKKDIINEANGDGCVYVLFRTVRINKRGGGVDEEGTKFLVRSDQIKKIKGIAPLTEKELVKFKKKHPFTSIFY